MTDRHQSDERSAVGTRLTVGRSRSVSETVTAPLTTVHLPPDRAVLTTPGMIGLMERCIAGAEREDGAGDWQSRTVEVRHRAGLRSGENCTTTARLEETDATETGWRVSVESLDGRVIGDGVITRVRI